MVDARLEFSDLVRESVTANGNSGDEGMSRAAQDIWMQGFDERIAKRDAPAQKSPPNQSALLTAPLLIVAAAIPATQAAMVGFAADDHQRTFRS
jgi:hypothetical protein